ncbi:hypothetical protein BEL04_03620 [Mucilaginibacter sp. PPCGB 2223]|uniref:hypothetical protein n=1 Tax=Mucilaginibacter sp. PPCGB 2223 TaxID=1886027 RepID=UPI0008243C49|nr:hypothetical protein [Mucilaginibacter sp. PPCGB 2223]OCX53401.1 hypothetical protein BEL04_03620 [Mucilaginibacter sp. PPCGB 2223]
MLTDRYLKLFQKALGGLDLTTFKQKGLELKAGVWLNSVALKIQKSSWRNDDDIPFQSAIFFSVWLNDETLSKNKLYYNIHALKLRELNAYKLKSRDFADEFRKQFKQFEDQWPNVSTAFGPLTLMEGWVSIDGSNLENQIQNLAQHLLNIDFIIDGLLERAKK